LPPADWVNAFGAKLLDDRRHLTVARGVCAAATLLGPGFAAPWFNRGLVAKFQRRWADCRAFNARAVELDPRHEGALWNLGIAATALGDWETARRAWSGYGINLPAGTGPIEMNLGAVPIRITPLKTPEVVWCRRIDPARAIVRSVPTPESGRGFGDLLLHDGEPRGKRLHGEREVSVFDELELLAPGPLSTFVADVVAPADADVEALVAASGGDFAAEDWTSSLQMLCKQCSEGSPHDHEPHPEPEWKPEREIGVAALDEAAARALLAGWAADGTGRAVGPIECVLDRRA
jgi:hypothetical protein